MPEERSIPSDPAAPAELVRQGHEVRSAPLALPEGAELTAVKVLARYARRPDIFGRAEAVTLLVNGQQAYPDMLAAIDSAAQSVDLETYIFADDRTGKRFIEALCGAARRGVQVRLMYDYIGSLGLSEASLRRMTEAGVEVAVFHPFVLSRPVWALNRRNHRKTLIVDGEVLFTGGLNVADDYAAVQDGGADWRDTHVRIVGQQAARQAMGMFETAWRRAVPYSQSTSRPRRLRAAMRRLRFGSRGRGAKSSRADALSTAAERGAGTQETPLVCLLSNRRFGQRNRIHRAYLHAIGNSRHYVLIENAYFIPTGRVLRALEHAVRRGVVVAVAVARDSDVRIAACASRHLYGKLLQAGVRVFEWPSGMLHAKTAVIDNAWSIVGSYNFDHRSLFHQLESVAVVAHAGFARELRDQTLADIARCREITLPDHQSRPLLRRLVDWAAYLLRHWL